jgi:MYXO-CTERM domain-containing protein
MRFEKQYVLILLSAGALAASAQADVLWDQSAHGPVGSATIHNEVPATGNGTGTQVKYYGLSDVTVPAGGWTIDSISVYLTANVWQQDGVVTQGVLNFFPKTGTLPAGTNDPRPSPLGSGTTVTVTQTVLNGVNTITASGLGSVLAPGDWWVGLTPIGPGSTADSQYVANSFVGDPQAATKLTPFNNNFAGAWFDDGFSFSQGLTNTDGAILITGSSAPAPASLGLLGLGGLITLRRRR